MMTEIVTDTSDESIMKAVHDNWYEWLRIYGKSSKIMFVEEENYSIFCGLEEGQPQFSYCIRIHTSEENREETLDQIFSFFEENGNEPMFSLTPIVKPSNIGSSIEARGLAGMPGNAAMAIDLNKFKYEGSFPEGLEIKRVYNDTDTRKFWKIYYDGYPDNRMIADLLCEGTLYVGYDEDCLVKSYLGYYYGKPVATSQLILTGGVAGLFSIVVLPEARGKGIGTTMTIDVMQKAKDLGYKISLLWATKKGITIYKKLGFEEVFKPIMYMKTGEH